MYFKLMKERPELFKNTGIIKIVTDKKKIEEYEKETGKKIGIAYRSKYNTLLVDLIEGEKGYYTYERVIPTSTETGIVIVAEYEGKLVLLNQYRHALRKFQYAFVRGFGEDGIDAPDNVKKEIKEEINAEVLEGEKIGEIASDSGLTSSIADVYYCKITKPEWQDVEGIKEIGLYSEDELLQK